MKEKTLKEKTFSGLSWSAVDKLFQQSFVFVSGIVLARILDKENFGLIGILAIFITIANLLQDSGFSTALIRKKNTTQDDYITVFYTNICIGIIAFIVMFFVAPLISDFYEKPILTNLSRFIFLSFLFNSFGNIQNALLLKRMEYKVTTKINLFSVLVSYSASLILAYSGFGVWALASQIVIMAFCRNICLWLFGGWKPAGSFSIRILKEYYSFSSKLMLAYLLNAFSNNIPQNIIAKQYNLGITGLYNQASKLYYTVIDFLWGTLQTVPFTVLSQIEETARLKNAVRKFARARAFIFFPILMGVPLVAESFIVTFLGEKWIDATPILQLLCIGGIFSSLDSSNNELLRVKGKSGTILALDIIKNALMFLVIFLVLFFDYNYLYLVSGLSLAHLVRYIIACIVTNRSIGYRAKELLKDLLPYAVVSCFAIICGYLLRYLFDNQLMLFVSQIFLVAFLYITILYLGGSVLVKEAITVVLKKVSLKKRRDN